VLIPSFFFVPENTTTATMTISALLFYSDDSELILSYYYKDARNVNPEAFRDKVMIPRNFNKPVLMIDNCSYMYVKDGDLILVAVTLRNANTMLVFQFLYQLIRVLKAYFGQNLTKDEFRGNMTLIYELLDEMMDNGIPQICSVEALQQYIKGGAADHYARGGVQESNRITSEITGAQDWRKPGLKYRKNEVYIDVLESVNLLTSSQGTLLRSNVSGRILMKTCLSGMPTCKFGMNDKLQLQHSTKVRNAGGAKKNAIAIDDVTFHRCVKLGMFEQDRVISFIPPDGEYDLMKYRITKAIKLPFKVKPQVTEKGRNRVEYDIEVKATYKKNMSATNVVLKIPVPRNTAKADVQVTMGKAKYEPSETAIVWRIKRFQGQQDYKLKGEANLTHLIKDKAWARPPIEMDFQVPMFAASGLEVKFLKVVEKSNYQTIKWVRYITKAGSYQIRI